MIGPNINEAGLDPGWLNPLGAIVPGNG